MRILSHRHSLPAELDLTSAAVLARFPASSDPAVFAAQQTMVEAWTIVGEVFVDGRFGGHNWDRELADALNAAYTSQSGEGAFQEISHMLTKLGDPFTRIVPARYACSSADHKAGAFPPFQGKARTCKFASSEASAQAS